MQKVNQYFDRAALLVLGMIVILLSLVLGKTQAVVAKLSQRQAVIKTIVVTPTASPSATIAPTKATVHYTAPVVTKAVVK